MTLNKNDQKPYDLDALRKQLADQRGKTYWRSLKELADSNEFPEVIRREFPRQAQFLDEFSRRDFLKVLGASLAMAGLTSCMPRDPGTILPYSSAPEDLIPGKPLFFASAMPKDGYAQGVLVRSEMGRPIKVDGNPRHPISQGTSDIFMQASILDLYDPDRAQKITSQGVTKTWNDFTTAISTQAGQNLRILTGPLTSPSLVSTINDILAKFPNAKWHQYSPLSVTRHTLREIFEEPVDVQYRFDKAKVILALDSDFLFREPGSLRYSQDFGLKRNPDSNGEMNRLYVVESSLSLTGSNADHRLALRSGDVEGFARALARQLGLQVDGTNAAVPGESWIKPLASDLLAAKEAALVIAGERQPAAVHALAFAINQMLGAVGNTAVYTTPVEVNPIDQLASLKELCQALDNNQVDTLLILEGNPAYNTPVDLNFANLLKKAKLSVYLGQYADETAVLTTWHVPAAHYLETWGDLRAFDGTTSIVQPLIEPLYGGKSAIELLAVFLGQVNAKGYDLVRNFWASHSESSNFDVLWRQTLRDGFFEHSSLLPNSTPPALKPTALTPVNQPQPAGTLEIVFEPDPTIWDGQYTNNAWLQELPKPLTKITWDNAVMVSPKTAQRLSLQDRDVVLLQLGSYQLEAPVFIQPGQAEDSLTISLGYGRNQGGKVLGDTGFNAYSIRTSDALWFSSAVTVKNTSKKYPIVTTHGHQSMEGRDLVREATLSEYLQNPNFAKDIPDHQDSLYEPFEYAGHAWGMTINLGACIGCNACVLACQSENNIPTVGKEQVDNGREMHWLRVDRYFEGNLDAPSTVFEPVPCMHCEQAPCEPVCPVEATSHSAEGINEMTYNRCVGTRYCSNNCPYKVRRFNFLQYNDDTTPVLKLMRNPDVTVRARGVMEKCTYCIQRVNAARIQAEVTGIPLKDGDVKTACQVACPTQAIVFGDLNDPASQVRKSKESPLNYALLGHLGTKPRTTYLGKVTNPNQQLKDQA